MTASCSPGQCSGATSVTVILATEKGATASVVKSILPPVAGPRWSATAWATSARACRPARSTASPSLPRSSPSTSTSRSRCRSPRRRERRRCRPQRWPGPVPARPTTTPTCRPATPGRSRSRTPTAPGTAAGHDRRHRLRCRPPPGPTGDEHRRAQDRRLGHRDAPLLEGDGSWRAMLTSVSGPTFAYAGRPGPPRPARTRSTAWRRASRRTTRRPAISTATATRPTGGVSSTTRPPTTSGWTPTRTSPSPSPRRCALQGGVRGRPLRHRRPGDRDRRVHAVRRGVPRGRRPEARGHQRHGGLRQHRRRRVGPRHPRRGHRRRSQPLRRGDGRPGPGRQDRLEPGLLVGRGLHGRGPHRRHGRPRGQPGRRCRQHVDRRPAGAQRRQQRARPPLRHPHQRRGCAARHLGRQQRPRHQLDRRPVGRHQCRERGLVHHQGDVAVELRRRGHHPADAAQLLLARSARGRRLQAQRDGSGLGDLLDPDPAAGRPGTRGRLLPAAGLRHVQRHVDGLPADRGRCRAAAVRGQGQRAGRDPAPAARLALHLGGLHPGC